MSDAVDRGITVTEIAAMDQPIDATPETIAAFVGRALRGPLNTPVLINNFAQFRRRFGGIWTRSSLGPAVQRYFEHGGKELYVVRVANGAQGAMVHLPAGDSTMLLRAVEPGSTERIRAAVDYDGVDDQNDDLFNLTVQRVSPETRLVVDQELYRDLSCRPDSDAFVGDAMLSSSIARLVPPFPDRRPSPTRADGDGHEAAYVDVTVPGADGSALSDYDLVGSRRERTGLFALQGIEQFDLLYLPPTGKYAETGPTALLAADRYCRERGAMLIADPPSTWGSAGEATHGVRSVGLASSNMLIYFPRARSRSGSAEDTLAIGGAVAGILCKLDRTYGPWNELDQPGLGLSRDLEPVNDLHESDLASLMREGINAVVCGPGGKARVKGSVTLGRGSEANRVFASLPMRRLVLRIVKTVDTATRWAVFERHDAALSLRLSAQIRAYLRRLFELGALENDRFVVQCDASAAKHEDALERGVTILLGFTPRGSEQPLLLTLHQAARQFRVASALFAPIDFP